MRSLLFLLFLAAVRAKGEGMAARMGMCAAPLNAAEPEAKRYLAMKN
jgi:hypothetical protein